MSWSAGQGVLSSFQIPIQVIKVPHIAKDQYKLFFGNYFSEHYVYVDTRPILEILVSIDRSQCVHQKTRRNHMGPRSISYRKMRSKILNRELYYNNYCNIQQI